MKKFTIMLVSLTFLGVSAQQKMNIVKTNVTAFAFRNINLSYERAVNRWFSINVGFGTVPAGSVPFSRSFLGSVSDEFSNVSAGLTNFTVEPRFYIGKGFGQGFYFAPYYRYTSVSADRFVYTYDYSDSLGNNEEIPLDVSGKATANSVGLMIGAQFLLGQKDNWVLDWWIAGAHYGGAAGTFEAKSRAALNPDKQAAIRNDIEELNLPVVKYSVTTDAGGAHIKMDGPWAGFRTGLSLGYRF